MNTVKDFLRERAKAIAGFAAPLIVAQIARFFHVDVDVSLVEQLIVAAVTALTVHQVANA